MTTTTALGRAVDRHRRRWVEPSLVVRAPGRVNLIGEHTDYNEGFALPMALPVDTVVAISDRGDDRSGLVEVDAAGFGTIVIDPAVDPRHVPEWARHVSGVIALTGEAGVPSGGWRGTIDTDIPVGAGLSSSAALEVAVITALVHRADRHWSAVDVARLGQRVEHEVVGLPSGIMDQLVSASAIAGHASLIDFRSLGVDPRQLPDGVVVAVMDTGTRRQLAEAAYADRRASCERASQLLGLPALRDATVEMVDGLSDDVTRRRARHVVTENDRTLAAARALEAGEIAEVGRLMDESHTSLRDDFEVSAPALDAIVDVARRSPGCLGARMTGGGFAGCAVALVLADRVDQFVAGVTTGYRHEEHTATIWICEPAAGASVVTPPR